MISRGRWRALLIAASLATAPAGAALGAPDAGGEALTDKARELHREGEALFKKKEYARARASFLAAWSLKPHWSTAGNLADCEVKLGLYRDAAEHFAFFVRGSEREKVPVPEKALARYREAVSKVGVLDVRVTPAGAEVLVDGKLAGTVPLEGPVFVEPGEHTLEARLGSKVASLPLALKAGETREVVLDVTPGPAGVPGEVAGAGGSGPAGVKAAASDKGGVPAWYEASESPGRGPAAPAAPEAAAPAGGGGHPKAVFVVGGAIAGAAAVGTGVALAFLSGGKASDADALLGELRRTRGPCSAPPPSSGCAELMSLREERDLFANAAMVTLIGGGVIWAATAAYTFWPRSDARPVATTAWVVPVVAPQGGGLWIGSTF
ncbi:hypothetical protein WMF27_29605 [Sorangium sp. So ce281]|uniref:hypothetical protein n=1 Tax=unclassified Sorangium TaxID=2621164 RepID=UPI003F623632